MGIRDLHSVDFNEYKIVHFLRKDGRVQLSNDFANGCRLPCAWCSGDVDASTGSFHDGSAKMTVDCLELGFPTWERRGDGGYVQNIPCLAIGRSEMGR